MSYATRPTHWVGVDSREFWPDAGCPIDWDWLARLGIAYCFRADDGNQLFRLLAGWTDQIMDLPEDKRPNDWPRFVSYLACHSLAALNYIGTENQ